MKFEKNTLKKVNLFTNKKTNFPKRQKKNRKTGKPIGYQTRIVRLVVKHLNQQAMVIVLPYTLHT